MRVLRGERRPDVKNDIAMKKPVDGLCGLA